MNSLKSTEKNILLVEDEYIIAFNEKNLLENYGYRVTIANNGEKAIDLIQQNHNIDLILMDIDLGNGIDGTETAKIILQHKDIPIVFLSSHSKTEVVQKTEKITSYGYILKSSSITVIDASIKMAFKLFEAKKQIKQSEKKYYHLFENNISAFALHETIYDDNGNPVDYRFLEVNPAFEKLTGLKAKDILNKTILEILPDSEKKWFDICSEVVLSGNPISTENYSQGLNKYFDVSVFKTEYNQFACIFNDITDRKSSEEKIKIQSLELRKSLDKIDIAYRQLKITNEELSNKNQELDNALEKLSKTNEELESTNEELDTTLEELKESNEELELTNEELESTNEELRITSDELELTNEKLGITNEELESTNEELRITSDELELTNDKLRLSNNELRETNEKLKIINEELKSTNEELQISNDNLLQSNLIIKNIPIGVYLYHQENINDDKTLKLIYANPYSEIITGKKNQDVVGKTLDENFPSLRKIDIPQRFAQVIKKQKSITFEDIYYTDHNNITFVYYVKAFPLSNNNVVICFDNITKRKKMEDDIKENNFRLKTILDTVDALIYITDMQTYDVLFINEYGKKHFGDVIGKKCWQTLQNSKNGPCSFCSNNKLLDKNGKSLGVYQWEYQNTINGKWYEYRDTVIKWLDGRYVRIGIATDISYLKKAETDMIKLNNSYDKVFNSTTSSMFILKVINSETFKYIHANLSFQKLTSISLNDIINKTPFELLGEKQGKIAIENYKNCYIYKESVTYEEILNFFNEEIILETSISPIMENNNVRYIVGSSINITERKKLYVNLKANQEKLNSILNNIHDLVWSVEYPSLKYLYISPAVEKLYRRPAKDFFDNPLLFNEVVHPDDKHLIDKSIEQLLEKGESSRQCRILRPDGSIAWIDERSNLICDNNNNPIGIDGVTRDITERIISENKIISLLNEKEMLLKESHHRIKNNMYVIRSILSIEANMQDDNSKCKDILIDCEYRIMTMMTLYDFLYQNEVKETMDISSYLKNLLEQFLEIYKHKNFNIEVDVQELYLKPKIMSKIGIIINELFTNAIKYAPKSQENLLLFLSLTKQDNIINLTFSDNGIGLADTISLENAQTFGLQLIDMLVREINGTVRVERIPGTKFIIEFNKKI